MSFVIYGTDNSKRVVVANNIHEAYNTLVSTVNKYMLTHYNYKIERLYKWRYYTDKIDIHTL